MRDRMEIRTDDKHLAQLGENTAKALVGDRRTTGRRVWRSIRRDLAALRESRARVSAWAGSRTELPQAAEWLLDNWYLAQREGQDAALAFQRAGTLPAVRREGIQPLVLELARAMAWAGEVTVARLALFLGNAQIANPLTERELSLFIPALKGALAERLVFLCQGLEELLAGKGSEEDGLRLARGMEETFSALRTLSNANLDRLLEESSPVEQLLQQDPAGEYAGMDEATRARYRDKVCRLARKRNMSERDVGQKVLDLARAAKGEGRHVGWFLFRSPLGEEARQPTGVLYVGAVILPTLFLVLLTGFLLNTPIVPLLLLFPVSDLVKNCLDFCIVRIVPPRPICRMALKGGVPSQGKTLCVIVSLLTGEGSGASLAALLERYRLANRDAGENLLFGVLVDLPDSALPMGTAGRGYMEAARAAIDALNAKHGGGFYLFFRPPVFHSRDERYMGWERKRGALLELTRLLKGRGSSLKVEAGERSGLNGIRYVITLDSDTNLNVGAARELIGAMLHPLNRPVVDHRRRVVTSGYGLLQPRVGVELGAANKSQFSRIFAGQGGVDPYGGACSDVYHDLFDQGTFTGKGIFDVDAFFLCLNGRLPQNKVLSHDLLEGSYLHAGLIGEVELTDGYPYKVTSYFSRLHRWVRGDWQLLPWLGRYVPNEAGEREPNPIPSVAKWKMFDNLRRSLSPVFTLLALLLGMCFSGAAFGLAATVAILSAASNLLLSGADLAFRRGAGLRARYHSTIIAGFGGVILQTLVQLLFLPYHAWTCATAIVTALWRSLISHRGLLAWVTAAEAERKLGDGILANYRKQLPSVAVGLFAMVFSTLPAGAAVGLVWVLSPVFAWAMSRPIVETRSVSTSDRAFLLHEGALIWRYFADFLRKSDHWLPPDNWQEQPNQGLARRTSPTNIGMALLCVLAAVDLDFLSRKKAVTLLGHMLDTIESLPKWRGHLYNWYTTDTARAMTPRYVSSVDGGNFCACLIALREGLYEWGEDALARRAEALSEAMDFSQLYDAERKLFYIGYDVEKESYTQGWYDLMASEARQTSYLAVARGQVEPRHWRRLGRMLVRDNDYSGMASWTGTMFEYFMPNLLLPCERNSLMYESLAFCIYAQRRRGAKTDTPWGISESGFYAFDAAMNYQYKAHGVQKLGLKRGLDADLVVAPYASFLTLLLAPGSASRNLKTMRDMGMEGKYGLYEAMDFTASRLSGDRKGEIVRSYMAHHLGMSLVAIDNALNNNIMQERFMRDCAMAAYRELLQEKVPVGAPVSRIQGQEVPEKPRRLQSSTFQRTGEDYDRAAPACHLVSNGSYTVFCTDTGTNISSLDKITLTRSEFGKPNAPAGLSFFLRNGQGELFPLTPAPSYQDGGTHAWNFSGGGAKWSGKYSDFTAKVMLRVPERESGELWEVEVNWQGESDLCGELVCYFEPVLAPLADYRAHPAFSKLSIESSATGDGVCFTRRPRNRGEEPIALAVAWDALAAQVDTARERALGRGGLCGLETALRRPAGHTWGPVLDPCLLARFPLRLRTGEEARLRLALAAGSVEDAPLAAQRILRQPRADGGYLDRLSHSLDMTSKETLQAFYLLDYLAFPSPQAYEQEALWPFGISGDFPIAACWAAEGEGCVFSLAKGHKLLARCGFAFDLVFLLRDGGDYRRPARTALLGGIKTLHLEGRLGARGGIHLVDGTDAAVAAPILAAAALVLEEGDMPIKREKNHAEKAVKENDFILLEGIPKYHFTPEGEFVMELERSLPPLGWSQILAGPNFGWLTDETGCGHLWKGNSRECQITPWNNDPLAIGGPEFFFWCVEGEGYSVFAAADGLPCKVTYGFGFARWEKRWGDRILVTTAFVPPDGEERILRFELKGEPCTLRHGEELYPLDGQLTLATGAEGTRVFVGDTAEKLRQTVAFWRERADALRVETPDGDLNHYLNGWALYQVVACRLFARTSRYQNGGAYGFRDQLQDVCAALVFSPDLAEEQIFAACAHQFSEGDVLHWWHEVPQGHKGVRTRISDDLLWLPYTLCEYLEKWGDTSILTKEVPYLSSLPLGEEEGERYEQAKISQEMGLVYDHAIRAIECVLHRGVGSHGLTLMGGGDWNDGMNRVGRAGRGESVWLTWFAAHVLERFAPIAEKRGEPERAGQYRETARRYAEAANAAWDGDWYLRGYYDDGATLGSHLDEECRIDSIAQSWAVLAGGEQGRAKTAVKSALDQLFNREGRVVKLFTPPFDSGEADPGYIRGYLPGVRENGGQYTHASVWLALACFRLNMVEEGWAVLRAILPGGRDEEVYRVEPYVLAADVYANPSHLGRGGWSWYTGAAGWFYRTALEELLGLKLRAGRLFVEPRLPADWPGYTAVWRTARAEFRITVTRGEQKNTLLDGEAVQEGIPLEEYGGEHTVTVVI